jgi:hypothetical protein
MRDIGRVPQGNPLPYGRCRGRGCEPRLIYIVYGDSTGGARGTSKQHPRTRRRTAVRLSLPWRHLGKEWTLVACRTRGQRGGSSLAQMSSTAGVSTSRARLLPSHWDFTPWDFRSSSELIYWPGEGPAGLGKEEIAGVIFIGVEFPNSHSTTPPWPCNGFTIVSSRWRRLRFVCKHMSFFAAINNPFWNSECGLGV